MLATGGRTGALGRLLGSNGTRSALVRSVWAVHPLIRASILVWMAGHALSLQPACCSRQTALLLNALTPPFSGSPPPAALIITSQVDGYLHSLQHLRRTGSFPRPPASAAAPPGQAVLDVFPQGWRERYLSLLGASGCSVQLYLQPGTPDTQGRFYHKPHGGKLAVVLGAGAGPWLLRPGNTCENAWHRRGGATPRPARCHAVQGVAVKAGKMPSAVSTRQLDGLAARHLELAPRLRDRPTLPSRGRCLPLQATSTSCRCRTRCTWPLWTAAWCCSSTTPSCRQAADALPPGLRCLCLPL